MKVRLAKKIMKPKTIYWRMKRYWYGVGDSDRHSKDHRIAKAIRIMFRKRKSL